MTTPISLSCQVPKKVKNGTLTRKTHGAEFLFTPFQFTHKWEEVQPGGIQHMLLPKSSCVCITWYAYTLTLGVTWAESLLVTPLLISV